MLIFDLKYSQFLGYIWVIKVSLNLMDMQNGLFLGILKLRNFSFPLFLIVNNNNIQPLLELENCGGIFIISLVCKYIIY